MAKRKKKNAYITFVTRQNQTPQFEPIPGSTQVPNSAGGYSWELDHWDRLTRFLILGSEGGTYYISERTLTRENAEAVVRCIEENGPRAVAHIVDISDGGRAPKNTPAIFALALAAAAEDVETRRLALGAIPKVCRTGTHLFQFATFVDGMRGWGRALRRGVAGWYTGMDTSRLAYQVMKYRQREGWTHTDLLRMAHPVPDSAERDAIFRWVTQDETPDWVSAPDSPEGEGLAKIWAYEKARSADDVNTVIRLIQAYNLPREAIPTNYLNEVEVWDALLEKMPMTAMIRNLGNMSRIGLLKPMTDAERIVVDRLSDRERLRRARVHPLAVLSALRVYGRGRGFRGSGTWKPAPRVVDALEDAFELAFGVVEPANKRTMLALDVSGSMMGGEIAGVMGLSPREGSAAMSMITARTESSYMFTAFAGEMVPLDIHARMSLHDVVKTVRGLPFGRTDCALPMLYAIKEGISVDTFVIYTDSETWFGKIHPAQALREYREKSGIAARLVVVGMVSNGFTIADPDDAGMMDVVGFDTAAPNLMNAFSRGEL